MKLLLCLYCGDVFTLHGIKRHCVCGRTSGVMFNHGYAVYYGMYARPLGINSHSLSVAVSNQAETKIGYTFSAFVYSKDSDIFVNQMTVENDKEGETVQYSGG